MKTFMLIGLLTVSLIVWLGLKWLWDNIEVKDTTVHTIEKKEDDNESEKKEDDNESN